METTEMMPERVTRIDVLCSQFLKRLLNQGTRKWPVNNTVIRLLINMFRGNGREPRVDLPTRTKSITDG